MDKIIIVANEEKAQKQISSFLSANGFIPVLIEDLEPDFQFINISKGYRPVAKNYINSLNEKYHLPVIFCLLTFEISYLGNWPAGTIDSVNRQYSGSGIEEYVLTRLVNKRRNASHVAILGYGRQEVVLDKFIQPGIITLQASGEGAGFERLFCPRGRKLALNRLSDSEKEKFDVLTKILEQNKDKILNLRRGVKNA